jgi:hypothetical protein
LRNARSSLGAVGLLGFACLLSGPAPPAAAEECPRFVAGSQGLPVAWEWRTHPALGDVNEDGHLDIAAHPRKGRGPHVWLGDGKGAWTLSSEGLAIPGMSCGVGVALGDVNGDDHLDLGVADHCHGIFVFHGDGSGNWRLGKGVSLGGGYGYEDLQFGDLNGDGKLDLIAVGSFNGGFAVYLGDGKGGWQKGDVGLPAVGSGRDVKLADADHDGVLDVFASFTADPVSDLPPELRHNVAWLSAGQEGYRRAPQGISTGEQSRGVAVGDVDGDGELDLALTVLSGRSNHLPLRVYRGDGAGHWKLASDGLPDSPLELSFSGVGFTDLDGDGNQDLVALTWMDAAIRVWRGDGAGHWEECSETGLPSGRTEYRSSGLALRDLNGDGKPDVVAGFGKGGHGSLEVWLQR